jgi:hypothetical protein
VPSFAPKVSFRDAAFELALWQQHHPGQTAPDPGLDAMFDRVVTSYHAAESLFFVPPST